VLKSDVIKYRHEIRLPGLPRNRQALAGFYLIEAANMEEAKEASPRPAPSRGRHGGRSSEQCPAHGLPDDLALVGRGRG